MKKEYDVVIVGAGLTGAIWAWKLYRQGAKVLVLEKTNHPGGLCWSEKIEGIEVHKYGCHIFHTDRKEIWDTINQVAQFDPFCLQIKAKTGGRVWSLPFGLSLFQELWGLTDPGEVISKLESQRFKGDPSNLEEKALSMVGQDIYQGFIKGYTEKQWGKPCAELPESIITRLPIRYTWDTSYFNDRYVGIPTLGWTDFIKKLLSGAEVRYMEECTKNTVQPYLSAGTAVIWTPGIDEYHEFCLGPLEYRHVFHVHDILEIPNFQGCPVMNYPDPHIPWTRIVEHKWFSRRSGDTKKTIITKEYSGDRLGQKAYPIPTQTNLRLYNQYRDIPIPGGLHFIGRLAEYRYLDMNQIIEECYDTEILW